MTYKEAMKVLARYGLYDNTEEVHTLRITSLTSNQVLGEVMLSTRRNWEEEVDNVLRLFTKEYYV